MWQIRLQHSVLRGKCCSLICTKLGPNNSFEILYLEITKTEFDDFGEIQKMIEELAIYENMLDQCHMTVDKLKEDYENGPQVIPEYSKPKFYSSIARIDGKVVGYTVSIGKF